MVGAHPSIGRQFRIDTSEEVLQGGSGLGYHRATRLVAVADDDVDRVESMQFRRSEVLATETMLDIVLDHTIEKLARHVGVEFGHHSSRSTGQQGPGLPLDQLAQLRLVLVLELFDLDTDGLQLGRGLGDQADHPVALLEIGRAHV